MRSAISVYIVHHPQCAIAHILAGKLFDWFRLGSSSGDFWGAGLPVYFRRKVHQVDPANPIFKIKPAIDYELADLNVVILLVDQKMVLDPQWRAAAVELAKEISEIEKSPGSSQRAFLLPVAMHESFYQTGPLYEGFNPIRLIGQGLEEMEMTLRRATTEATARRLRAEIKPNPPPLDVFVSHAKRDGRSVAEEIRDSIRRFGQLVAWYDANDLPYGAPWNMPMKKAARGGTAAMISVVTDAYPSRPWCRKEAVLARTPSLANPKTQSRVWKLQPVVAVNLPQSEWVRGIPMLEGVPRIGWNERARHSSTEQIVDRLVLEVLLGLVHRKVATQLENSDPKKDESCYITWVPDSWTLAALSRELAIKGSTVQRVVYPGYGLTNVEIGELEPVLACFGPNTQLISFEEAMA